LLRRFRRGTNRRGRSTDENFSLSRTLQALFALVDALSKTFLACVPEPSAEAKTQAVALARERYHRLIKSAGVAMSGDSCTTMKDLLSHREPKWRCRVYCHVRHCLGARTAAWRFPARLIGHALDHHHEQYPRFPPALAPILLPDLVRHPNWPRSRTGLRAARVFPRADTERSPVRNRPHPYPSEVSAD
jgi:hypothetical protein